MPTITTGDLEVVLPKGAKKKIQVEEQKAGTEIVALKNVSKLETTVTGDAAFVGKGVSKSSVDLKSTKKNTPKVVLQNTNFTKSDIKISRKGEGLQTEYKLTPCPKKSATKESSDAFAELACDLSKLFDGEDPFGEAL